MLMPPAKSPRALSVDVDADGNIPACNFAVSESLAAVRQKL